MELLYIIPAYNESDNIRKFIDDWYPIIETYNGNGNSRLVIVNDGSTDNTYKILQECAKTRPLLKWVFDILFDLFEFLFKKRVKLVLQ